MTKMSKTKRF